MLMLVPYTSIYWGNLRYFPATGKLQITRNKHCQGCCHTTSCYAALILNIWTVISNMIHDTDVATVYVEHCKNVMCKTYTHLFAHSCLVGKYFSRKKWLGTFPSTLKYCAFQFFHPILFSERSYRERLRFSAYCRFSIFIILVYMNNW